MNILEEYNQKKINEANEVKDIPRFRAGDTLKVHVRVLDGNTERVQIFEGVCIARKNRAMGSSFIVRKISMGEGIERIFPLYSPTIKNVDVVRRGAVRRAKLYYLRKLRGKAARIKELTSYHISRKKKI